MIIFDLDGTLADCEHRRHFVDMEKSLSDGYLPASEVLQGDITDKERGGFYHKITKKKWRPDWKSFYEACDKDEPIQPVIDMFNRLSYDIYGFPNNEIEIWSGRCESVKHKTKKWLNENVYQGGYYEIKMRPIDDSTPDDLLKERWLDQAIAQGKKIDFVFDDSEKCCNMWRRRGIFVFNCCQHDQEF